VNLVSIINVDRNLLQNFFCLLNIAKIRYLWCKTYYWHCMTTIPFSFVISVCPSVERWLVCKFVYFHTCIFYKWGTSSLMTLACTCFRVWNQAASWYLLVFWSLTRDLLHPHRGLDLTFTYKCFMYDCSWLLVIVNIVIFCISKELDGTALCHNVHMFPSHLEWQHICDNF
jgi:hypothetical protein